MTQGRQCQKVGGRGWGFVLGNVAHCVVDNESLFLKLLFLI